jgi:predicted PurR-regulated permease PerM
VAMVMLALVLVVTGLGFLVVPTAVDQIGQLIDRAPELYAQIRGSAVFRAVDRRFDIDRRVEEFFRSGTPLARQAVETSLAAAGTVAKGVIGVVTMIFTVTFMLLFGGRVVDSILAETLPATRERYERILAKVYRSIGGYLSGLALIAAINATLTSVFLAIVGVPFFLPLGILSGVGSLVPYVGAVAAGALIAIVAAASQGLWTGVGTLAYYVAYQQVLENHILVPLVYKRTVQLNPLVTLLAVVFLGDAAGIVGAILAIPAVAVGQIVLRELLLLRRERLHVPPTGEVTHALGGPPPPRSPDRKEREDEGPPIPH